MKFYSILLSAALFLTACSQSQSNDDESLILAALALSPSQTTIPFSLTNSGSEVSCGQTFTLGGDTGVQIRDFRFYLSEFAWITPAGEVEATLPDIENWQSRNVVLIDLEDGTGLCSSGTTETNSKVVLSPPPAGATGLAFSVGLPEDINKLDNTSSEAPFNIPAMYWSWSNGYKFAKIELVNSNDHAYSYHLGSRGCSGTPFTGCTMPLKGRAEINTDNPGNGLQFSLSDWFTGLTLHTAAPTGTPNQYTCMGNPGDTLCQNLRNHLGLNNTTGQPAAGNQKAFAVKSE